MSPVIPKAAAGGGSPTAKVYVERAVANEFAGKLADRAAQLRVGDPLDRDVYMGPVIDAEAVDRFKEAVKEARKGGRVLAGGEVLKERFTVEGNDYAVIKDSEGTAMYIWETPSTVTWDEPESQNVSFRN